MKNIFVPAVVLLTIILVSCDERDEPVPQQSALIFPLRLEQEDYERELTFDGRNRLSRVKTSSFMPGDVVLESTTQYFYGTDGKLRKAETDQGYRLEYTWQGDKIIRTDEYIQDTFSQYHTFTYDVKGRLHEFLTWQDILGEGEVVAKSKAVFLYDATDNLTNQLLYYYHTGLRGHVLLSSFEYSDYDDNVEAESLFDGYAYNPEAVFSKNNPGKMVTKNANGNTTLIDQYNYVYNARGYAISKTTTSIFSHNGSGGSYETRYYYEER